MTLEFVASIVSILPTIEKYVVDPIRRQLGYLLCYNCNIEDFRKQVENLEPERVALQIRVDDAERNGEVILPNVQAWLTSVNKIAEESRNLLNDDNGSCFNGHCLCLDLKLRYQRSRKAKKKTTDVVELKRDGKFDIVSCPAPPPAIGSTSTEAADVFESRKLIVKEIMEALKDDQINMIGIYGMGGVGKTTLVQEVGKQAKDDNLFDEVVMAAVSQTPTLRRIQDEIADRLGLTRFDAASDSGRAERLFERLDDKKMKLVILDDIWERLELGDIGIPFGAEHKSCKIVFTSRRQDVCEQMNTEKNFAIEVLSEREAWNLFRKMAGDSVDSPDLHSLAVKVAKECAGLPIAIVTVARALKNKSSSHWSDTANRLRKSNIPSKRVFECLELSYNYLESEEAKSFFLLCCLFPEDHDIEIQDLLKYAMGLGLFQDVDTVDEARDRAHTLANDLQFSCLLQEGDEEECVKMHDVVRDVAILIASKDKHVFLVRAGMGCKEWPKKDTYEPYTAISIMHNNILELPDGLECPKLQILLLERNHPSLQFPTNFFLRMENLKVLEMSGMHFLSLPPSLRYLKSLRTLCLDYSSLEDISVIGELKKLEILSFLRSDIKELPKEIGMLTHLRLLDLTDCEELKVIAPDVIRGLSQLEGLYMEGSFDNWEFDREDKERSNASLAELKHLSRLTTLELYIPDANCLPKDSLFENLSRFKISIGTSFEFWEHHYSSSKVLKLKLHVSTPLKDGVNVLLKKAEHLHLEEMKGLKSVLNDLDSGGFLHLRNLYVRQCNEVEYIIFNTTEMDDIVFPHLRSLKLEGLPNLRNFCSKMKSLALKGDLDTHTEGTLFDKKVAFPALETLEINRVGNFKEMWHSQLPADSFSQLRVLRVYRCHKVLNGVPFNLIQRLRKLEELDVSDCDSVEEVVEVERIVVKEEGHITGTLSQLRILRLQILPKLKHVWWDKLLRGTLGFQNMSYIDIYNCSSLKSLFSPSIANSLVQLREVKISSCEMMETIIAKEREGEENCIEIILFPQLRTLRLQNLPKLMSFYKEVPQEGNPDDPIQPLFDQKVTFPNLEVLKIKGLDNFEYIWHPQVPADSFRQLRVLEVESCHKILNVVPSNSLKGLKNLEEVFVMKCDSVETIFEIEELVVKDRLGIGKLSQLRKLKLMGLPKLLTSKHPFLQKLKMNDEEFEEKPEEGNSCIPIRPLFNEWVAFPALVTLVIRDVGNFKEMWHPQLPAESFSQLRVLKVIKCHKVLNGVPFNLLQRLRNLEELDVRDCDSVEEVVEVEGLLVEEGHVTGMLSQLRILKLWKLPKLKHMWWDKLPRGTLGFQNMISIDIDNCSSLKSLFSPSIASSLVQLRQVKINSCEMMETIIAKEREGEENCIEIIVFPQLRALQLQNLPILMSFYKEVPQEGNPDDPIQPLFNQKVTFPTLEELKIEGLDNLKDIWHPQVPAESFRQLRVLEVKSCHKLLNVVPSNWLKGLKNLEEVSVEECGSVEIIFEIEEVAVKDIHGTGILSRLKKLELLALPKLLTSIHPILQKPEGGNSSIPIRPLFDEWVTFPTLEELKIEGLDNLKDIWHPQVPAESFRQLRVLEVISCHKILNVVPSNSLKGLKNLEEVSVMQCDSVEIVFEIEELFVKDRHGIGNLSQLRKLTLSGLPKLLTSKHPFLQNLKLNDEEFKEKLEEGNSCIPIRPLFDEWVVALTNLEELYISDFENLQEIFHNQLPDKFFCQLKTLMVGRCNKLSRVFPSNLLPRLKNLENFYVSECNSVEEIFEGPIGEGQAIISLSQLQTLWLLNLPSLRVFCSGNYTLECPSLTYLLLEDCPKMHTFSSGFISTPQLNEVTLKGLEKLWKGDLNSTVQHLFHEKGKLKSDISSGQEVEEEEEGEKVHKKSEEADEAEEEVESKENVSAQAIQHEISELVEEEA